MTSSYNSIQGTDSANTLIGSTGADSFVALDGDDNVLAAQSNDIVDLGDGQDSVSFNEDADGATVYGRGGNDSLGITVAFDSSTASGGEGNDTINGGQGNDIAIYNGNFANYTITEISYGTYSITDNVGNDGTDTIINVEKFKFKDQEYSINRFITDVNGDGLVDSAINYYFFNNSLPIALKTSSGKQLSDTTDSSWNVVKAVQSGSGYKILLKGSANRQGKFQIRDTNAQGITTTYSGWETTNDALQLEWESIFGDFNNDGIIGFPIADANSDGLVDSANKYQVLIMEHLLPLKVLRAVLSLIQLIPTGMQSKQ